MYIYFGVNYDLSVEKNAECYFPSVGMDNY